MIDRLKAYLAGRRRRRERARYLAHPVLREDYRLFDSSKMTLWGHRMHPLGTEGGEWRTPQRFVAWSTPRPRDGDLALLGGVPHIIWDVERPGHPPDQTLFTVHDYPHGFPPPSTYEPSWTDGLV